MKIETLELLHDLLGEKLAECKRLQGEALGDLRADPNAEYLVLHLKERAEETRNVEAALHDFLQESWH